MTTENTSPKQNINTRKYIVTYHAKDSEDFQRALGLAREIFGHRGRENKWWWNINGSFRDKIINFKFDEEIDALRFKLCL